MPQRWQTYCIALCTRQTAGSCRAEFKGRPAPAPRADWLYARLVTAGQQRRPSGRPRPVTSGVSPARRANAVTLSCVRSPGASFFRLASGWLAGRGRRREGSSSGTFRWRPLPWTISLLAVFSALPHSFLHPTAHIPLPFPENDFPLFEAASTFLQKVQGADRKPSNTKPSGSFFPVFCSMWGD